MSPEKRVDHINTDNLNHSGNLDGAMRETPPKGAVPVEGLDTGEIEQLVPAHSGELELHEDERPEFQEKLAELRASHESQEQPTYYGFEPVIDQPIPSKEKKGRGKMIAAIGGAAATAVAAASLFLLPKGESDNNANKPNPTQPVASAEVTPGNKPTPAESAPATPEADTTKTLEFEAGQSDTALAQDFIAGLTKWNNAGGDQVFAYSKTTHGNTVQQTAAEFSKQQQQPFIDSFFDKSSLAKPDVANYMNTIAAANTQTLLYDLLTDPSVSPANKQRIHVMYDLNSPVERVNSQGESRTLRFTLKGHSNYKETMYKDKQTDNDDTLYWEYTVTFTPKDGVEKVTSVSATSHK